MSQPSALPATTPSDGRLRNALCVLLDHLELGQADVLAADVAWVSELVASFAVSPSEGSAPDTPKLDTSAELEALADDVTLRPRKGSYYFRVVTPDGGAIAMHLPKDRVTDSGRLLFERIHEALLAALGLRAAEKAAEPQRIVDV